MHPPSYALDVSFNRHKNVYFGIWCCFALFVVVDISCSIRELLLWNKYYAHCSTDPTKHAGEKKGGGGYGGTLSPVWKPYCLYKTPPTYVQKQLMHTVYRLCMQCMDRITHGRIMHVHISSYSAHPVTVWCLRQTPGYWHLQLQESTEIGAMQQTKWLLQLSYTQVAYRH